MQNVSADQQNNIELFNILKKTISTDDIIENHEKLMSADIVFLKCFTKFCLKVITQI
jgi:hypothetical protein